LWIKLGTIDFSLRYKSTAMGVVWHPLLVLIKIVVLSTIFSKLLNRNTSEYLPFLCLGIVTWDLISGLMHQACVVFIKSATYLEQIRCPAAVFVMKALVTELSGFFLSLTGASILLWVFSCPIYWSFLPVSLAGTSIVCLAGACLCYPLGMACSRFRDLIHANSSVLRIGFIITPVMWVPNKALADHPLVYLNPFYHFLKIVRTPLLDGSLPHFSLIVCLEITFVLFILAVLVFDRFRFRFLFWSLSK